ncbi:HAMP domain-containing sensor histidine kinase [Frigoribacterium sp. UYMn621]|jgi:signal transduction histidine kinase|uniref:sensor histidine kinase n=1 Tax=Frigoribacterium sp. UYMn621 TaxID=3156343 RepID=UPI00339AFA9F
MIFASTLRRLTIVYTVIQLILFGALAIGIYLFVTGTFDFDAASQDGAGALGAAELGFLHLRIALIAGFGMLCVVVPFTSYWMARTALRPLRQSYERQQQFVDDASHELRSPLSVIRGELELALSRRRSEKDYRRAISTALEATQDMVQLTEDLLLLAQDSSNEFESRLQAVSGDEVVRSAMTTVGTATMTDRVTVHSDAPELISGIPPLLVRALANLLDNALKFTPTGGSVTVVATNNSESAIFSVTDTGSGMTPHEIQHAFDRFWRATAASSAPGHGLGLALVERIAQAHRGRVAIVSTPGIGSTITLSVPLRPTSSRTR